MPHRLLLCTDLDRTLLPNGPEPESADARSMFHALTERPEVSLAYVTGRDRNRVEQAIDQYRLPVPDHVVADVGTTIYEITQAGGWTRNTAWEAQIGRDWHSQNHESLAHRLADLEALRLQETSRQNRFKLSYYAAANVDETALAGAIHARLDELGIRCTVIYSVDELRGIGLVDIVPACATKLHAIEFLIAKSGLTALETVFCGDSGNDLNVLASRIPGVLVANASAQVRRQALELARQQKNEDALYVARGSFLNLNGNYAGGILEGVAHYCPAALQWITESHADASEV